MCKEDIEATKLVYQCSSCQNFKFHQFGHRKIIEEDEKKFKRKVKAKTGKSQKPKYPPKKSKLTHLKFSNICEICDEEFVVGGPILTRDIHQQKFVDELKELVSGVKDNFKTSKRILNTLTGIQLEFQIPNAPLSIDVSHIQAEIKCPAFKRKKVINSIASLGFKCVQTYYNPNLWKTDAPLQAFYDVYKSFWFILMEKEGKDPKTIIEEFPEDSKPRRILSKPIVYKPDFEFEPKEEDKLKQKQRGQYFVNPESHWGPRARAVGKD